MDYQPKLLKYGFSTLLGSLIVVALLVIPGRAGAATYNNTFAYGSIGPISGPAFLGVNDNALTGLSGETFLDHFTFTVIPSNNFTLTTSSLYQSGVTLTGAQLFGPGATLIGTTGSPFFTASPTLLPGAYDLQISGTLTAASALYGVSVNFNSTTAPIPEPETYAMMLAGLGLMGFVARRRKQKDAA